MMWWNNGSGWGWPVFSVMALVGMAMMAGMAGMMMRHRSSGHMSPGQMRPAGGRDEDAPERILARRLASGEIDVQEFERLRDALRRTSPATDPTEPGVTERRPPAA